jgi:hypothetical protein
MAVERSRIVEMLKRIHLFRGVDEQRLQSAADLMVPVNISAGNVIFEAGDFPDFFYFIYDGRVQISQDRARTGTMQQLGFLVEGDYFGHELLESNWTRQVSATADTDVTLLQISEANFITILELIPLLGKRLQLILDSYRLMLGTSFKWANPDEMIYFLARRHILFLWVNILPPLFGGMIFLTILFYIYLITNLLPSVLGLIFFSALAFFFWFVWAFVDWANDYFIVTNQRIVYQERVVLLYDSRQESPNEAIQSTSINTSQLGRILGYGRVAIRTYIGTILFRDVSNPEQVMALIQEQQVRSQATSRRAEIKAIESAIERKINQLPAAAAPPPRPGPLPAKPNAFQSFMSDLLHLRYESGGTILYRTHWFILLNKIIVPSVLLIGLTILTIVMFVYQASPLPILGTCSVFFLVFVGVFLWWLYQYMDWHNDVYLITPDQIVDVNKKPLGRESRQAAPIKNILSIEYKRLGIIGLVLNYGTVFIRVGDQQLTFDDVFNPSEVQRELFHRLAAKNYSERQATAENERQRIAEWIGAYHRVAQQNRSQSSTPTAGSGDS